MAYDVLHTDTEANLKFGLKVDCVRPTRTAAPLWTVIVVEVEARQRANQQRISVLEDLNVGTISNIMQAITASQQRSAPKVCRKAGWDLLPQEQFLRVLAGEKKRSERFAQHMILMQLTTGLGARPDVLSRLVPAIGSVVRETDVTGWFEPNCSLGIIFTELGDADVISAERVIKARITSLLELATSRLEFAQLQLSFGAFCNDWADSPRKEKPLTTPVSQPKQGVIRPKLRIYPHLVGPRQTLANSPGSGSL